MKRIWYIISFLCSYIYSYISSNLFLLKDILSVHDSTTPGIIKYELKSKSDFEIAFLSILISLPPGTLVLAIKSDPATLYIHGTHAGTADEFRDQMSKLEISMLKALRPSRATKELGK